MSWASPHVPEALANRARSDGETCVPASHTRAAPRGFQSVASSPLLGPLLQPCGGGLAGLGGRWLTPCVLPLLSPSAQTTSSETNEGALLVERTGSDFSQTLFFLPLLVGGATCGWLALPLTLACPRTLHRHAASLSPHSHPQGFYLLSVVLGLSPLEALRNGKENIFFPTGAGGCKEQLPSPCHTAPRSYWPRLRDTDRKNSPDPD